MSIHDELERIAARAPEVVVPPDTWARAQRARRRDRIGLVAVVVAVLAIAGSLAWLPTRDDPPIADTGSLGVPDRLWGVPEELTRKKSSEQWASDEVTDDVTVVGVGAAAWVADAGLPVVVDASSGDYHLLDLPDFLGEEFGLVRGEAPSVALSPDGRSLAFAYAVVGPEAEIAPVPSGVRVVDLTTGDVREIPVPGEEGTAVTRIAWSPSSTWIAFAGSQQSWWTEGSMGTSEYLDDAGPVLGRIAPGSDEALLQAVSDDSRPLEIDDQGRVRRGRAAQGRPLGITADGRTVRLDHRPAGATDRIEVLAPDGSARTVVRLPSSIGYSLSVATGLMTSTSPTVARPEPEWPGTLPDWMTGAGVWLLLAIVGVAFGIRPARRWRQARAAR